MFNNCLIVICKERRIRLNCASSSHYMSIFLSKHSNLISEKIQIVPFWWQECFTDKYYVWKVRFVSNCAASPGASASFRDFGVLAVQANTVTGECQDLLNPSRVSFNMSGLPMGFWQKPICPHTSPSTPRPPTHPFTHPPAHGCLHKCNSFKDWTRG